MVDIVRRIRAHDMLGGMEVERTTRRPMPSSIALILISCAGFAVASSVLLVGAAIDSAFFSR
ncbi:hypothetical protein [Microbacterium sp. NPDC089188]|uniref:hypothetical protein n=1 Tax=Microbacterium sp. NPDC089188 TaxID=3154971 RepID=UPI003421FFD7